MKTSKTLSLILVAGLLQACGAYNKSPADGLQELKASAQKENDTRNLDVPQTNKEFVKVEVPKIVTVEVPVKVYETVVQTKTQATIDENIFSIKADENMTFVEGKTATFKIRARVLLVEDVKIKLTSSDLPAGAKLEASTSEAGLYTLTWTAPYGTIAANNVQKIEKMNLNVEVVSAPTDALRNQLSAIKKTKEVSLFVLRDQTPPSDLKVEGLKSEIKEGTITPFTVSVTVPGVDANSAQKPTLRISYDRVAFTQGNNFLEMDGSRHVPADSIQQEAKYLGNFRWQFAMSFDTKNVSVQPQLAKDGTAMPTADGTRVRLSFKAFSPFGSATAEQLALVKIVYAKELTSPRFDLSTIGGNVLEVSPGDDIGKMGMAFFVYAGQAGAEVKVEVPNLTGISGNPKIVCVASQFGNSLQSCQIKWSVPCNAKAADLNQKITLTAQTVIGDKKSDPVKQEIVLTPSKTKANKCLATAAGK